MTMRVLLSLSVIILFQAYIQTATNADELTLEQKRTQRDTLKTLRSSRATVDEKNEAATQLLTTGKSGADKLHAMATKEIERAFSNLLREAYKASMKASAAKRPRSRADLIAYTEEITELQKTLNKLAANPTKEQAQSIGLPGIRRLQALLLPTREELMAESKKLQESIDVIQSWQKYREQANRALKKDTSNSPEATKAVSNRVNQALLTSALMAVVSNRQHAKTLMTNEGLSQQILPREAIGILDLNRYRVLMGNQPLAIDVKLVEASRDHCVDMKTLGFFSHDSPVKDKESYSDRARNFGTSASGENIAMGQDDPARTNIQWYFSPGHHKNMLKPGYSTMGLGYHQKFWCQMFR